MRCESGDHASSLSDALLNVIWCGAALPSAGTSQRSLLCSFSSYDGSMTENTAHFPSGEIDGAPTRFISHIVSCVSCCLARAERVVRRRTRKGKTSFFITRERLPH